MYGPIRMHSDWLNFTKHDKFYCETDVNSRKVTKVHIEGVKMYITFGIKVMIILQYDLLNKQSTIQIIITVLKPDQTAI